MRKVGIYIHIPFCKKKCKYCDFISFENVGLFDEYTESVLNNIENIDKIFLENDIGKLPKDLIIDTVYIGGGTPSFISSKYILKILDKIKEKFKFEENVEITIEVNPGTITKEKLQDYYNVGINRLSIGLQSTKNEILNTIGRIHSFEDFLYTYNLARNIGFNNINIDLMLGLPNQTLNDLIFSLDEVVRLNPEHISLYSLILEEKTELEKEVKLGILKLPNEKIEREMYHKTKKILEKNNYIHYEISNFAKKDFYSKHNTNCWKQQEYLGFGMASHSYFNNIRLKNCENLLEYIAKNSKQVYNKYVEVCEKQNKDDKMKEYMMLGFRKLNGISFKEFRSKFNVNLGSYFSEEILKLKDKGLIEINGNYIKLSKKGLDFANLVFEEFV